MATTATGTTTGATTGLGGTAASMGAGTYGAQSTRLTCSGQNTLARRQAAAGAPRNNRTRTSSAPFLSCLVAAKVILTIKSAHNMRDKAWLGKSDPYW